MIRDYLDCCIFIDTPLDIALARRVLRDMKDVSADEIRREMETYLNYARTAYVRMVKDHSLASDHVIDGSKALADIVSEAAEIVLSC